MSQTVSGYARPTELAGGRPDGLDGLGAASKAGRGTALMRLVELASFSAASRTGPWTVSARSVGGFGAASGVGGSNAASEPDRSQQRWTAGWTGR